MAVENPLFDSRRQAEGLRGEAERAQADADLLAAAALAGAPAAEFAERQAAAESARAGLANVQTSIDQLLDAEAKLFATENADPIALLPVRVETVWWTESGQAPPSDDPDAPPAEEGDGNSQPTLRVRVYPDDLHLGHLQTELMAAEADAGATYWRDPTPEAWQELISRVRPRRAPWVARAMHPDAPVAVIRDSDAPPSPRTVTMPDRFRFIGFVDGAVVVDAMGRKIPDPLPIDLLEVDLSWTIDFFEARKAGMAVELELNDGVDHLDELIVVGVRDEPAAEGASRLRDLLRAHVYSTGLAAVHPGTATNNTPAAKSGWSSRPLLPQPGADPAVGERRAADAITTALGLADAAFLGTCEGMADADSTAVEGLSLLTWAALGRGFGEAAATHVDVSARGSFVRMDPVRPWRTIRDHMIEHVRGRGPLPSVRVGNQPYGILPTSSLDDWRPQQVGAADTLLLPWLVRLREQWRTSLALVPHLGKTASGTSIDELMVDILSRQPTPAGLAMARMNGPTTGVPRADPQQPTQIRVAGIPADGALRWSTDSDAWTDLGWDTPVQQEMPQAVTRMIDGHADIAASAGKTADYLAHVRRFLAAEITTAEFADALTAMFGEGDLFERELTGTLFDMPPGSGLLEALLSTRNWAFPSDEDDPLTAAFAVPDLVTQIVSTTLSDQERGLDPNLDEDLQEQSAAARRSAEQLARVEAAARAVAALPPARIAELVLEIVDVYAHRLDAWITSLASRRLAEARSAGVAGVRLGAYGWVHGLTPMKGRLLSSILVDERKAIASLNDGYVHAPSLQQATTAAVLRSGALSHPEEQSTYAVSLTSKRSRIARWLIAGVRQGHNLGALLGYRFERAMHDADFDPLIRDYRKAYPAPMVAEPDDPAIGQSQEMISARNVVDGMKLARDPDAASNASDPVVRAIIEDISAALDALSDLLLAESVHQLVIGNTARAGLTADALGRSGEVPDSFPVLTTPHRARPLTNRLAALLPDTPAQPTGWPQDDLARLLPAVEAWVAHLLGPAGDWSIEVASPDAPAQVVVLDSLNLGALSTALDVASARPTALTAACAEATGASPGADLTLGGHDWPALHGLATRIRTLLVGAQPLLPAHLPGAEVVAALQPVRERLLVYVDSPAVKAHPRGASLAEAARKPIGGTVDAPRPPDEWLAVVSAALGEVLGTTVPIAPVLAVSGPALASHPGVESADAVAWLARQGSVRATPRTLADTLLIAGLRSARTEPLAAAQHPSNQGDVWVGGPFRTGDDPPAAANRPAASTHIVWHAPLEMPQTITGFVIDEWVELLPGADFIREVAEGSPPLTSPDESELTGVAFHYDRPDAKAPHALLIAVPPNVERGWTPDTLVQVLRETAELGRLRAVDTTDLALPDTNDLLPAIRISARSAAGVALAGIENPRPDRDLDGPFRLEPNHRTNGRVDQGLAARVHDPLWLFTRQWQLGEFAGQDAASPALVTITGHSDPLTAWRPAGTDAWTPFDPAVPLDPIVEAESSGSTIDLRIRAEGGAYLRALLDAQGAADAVAELLPTLALRVDRADASLVGLVGVVGADGAVDTAGRGLLDGQLVAQAIAAGSLGADLEPVTSRWLAWWRQRLADHAPDCFDPHRFEHVVELSVGGSVLRAPEYLGDGLDWHSFDVDSSADDDAAEPGDPYTFSDESIPSVVRYGGVPADRFWEMEDARIDLGATDVSTLDTGRMLLISFATVYGNDWFLTPLEVPAGSLTTIERMLVRDVFGRTHLLSRASHDDPEWSMFSLYSDGEHAAANGLLMLPTTQGLTGEPLEHVGLTRDELANLAWAIQHTVTDDRGETVDVRNAWLRGQDAIAAEAGDAAPPEFDDVGMPVYRVRTTTPDYWFPLVPIMEKPGSIHFRVATINAELPAASPRGRLITPGLWIHEEEVPREGAAVLRRPVLARWFDGSWHSWTRREKAPAGGESSSGLAFDTVRPTDPWP